MKYEKSCGAVVFTEEKGERKYLLVRNQDGIYGFPKGHVEGTETELETAVREIQEETGLTVAFLPDFRTTDTYYIQRIDAQKLVVYFLARYADQQYHLQAQEITSSCLVPYPQAMELLLSPGSRRVLTEAEGYLNARNG